MLQRPESEAPAELMAPLVNARYAKKHDWRVVQRTGFWAHVENPLEILERGVVF